MQDAAKAVILLRRKRILVSLWRSSLVSRYVALVDDIMTCFRLGRILKSMAALVKRREEDVAKARAVIDKAKARRFFATMRVRIAARRKSEECVARVKR